jgi:propanol-preferring alcohol dehydrogenase
VQAWVVDAPAPIDAGPLRRTERELPDPGPDQVRVRVTCCGVCRTDLHLAEGDLLPRRPSVTPGHEVVGVVDARGPGAGRFALGERIGVAWLGRTDGSCRFCRRGEENLCTDPAFTGWDLEGGYADACLVDERFAYRLPDGVADEVAAPLLCAGIIGYRALRCAGVRPGGRLGIYGFGGSAHLTAQVALAQGLRVHVFTRGEQNRRLAKDLGADSVGGAADPSPELLDGAVLFAPAGELVPVALRALDRGATLAVAGIWLSDIPVLHYAAELFQERRLRSVTANTRRDGEEFLRLADRLGVRATTVRYPMARAPHALSDLAHGRFAGAAVLFNERPSGPDLAAGAVNCAAGRQAS